jgi:AcrR family transcriptional regulator
MARPVTPRGQGRTRVLAAALELFATHGVSGTSLQMIATHLGVTKAAVYYQFHTKEEIVLAVIEPAFTDMRAFVTAAEGADTPDSATDIALHGLVDLLVRHRRVMAALYRDPEVDRIAQAHDTFEDLTDRLAHLLLGPHPDTRRRVAVSVLGAGLAQAGIDAHLADLDDDVLRTELLHVGRTLIETSPPTA